MLLLLLYFSLWIFVHICMSYTLSQAIERMTVVADIFMSQFWYFLMMEIKGVTMSLVYLSPYMPCTYIWSCMCSKFDAWEKLSWQLAHATPWKRKQTNKKGYYVMYTSFPWKGWKKMRKCISINPHLRLYQRIHSFLCFWLCHRAWGLSP